MTTGPVVDTFSRKVPLIVAAAFFMEALDATIVVTALPAMAQDLGESTLDLAACITVYLVAMTVFVPMAGWASRRYNARNVFAGAVGVFALASLFCGLSPSFWTLIAARLMQGAAAAFMSPVGRLIVLREAPKHHIIRAIALIVWPALIAPVIGPPLGGLISTYASWRWIFFINIPLGLLGVFLILRHVPGHAPEGHAKFDAIGFVLTAAALGALIYGLQLMATGGHALVSGVGFAGVGIALGCMAVWYALRHPAPILDLRATRVPTFAFCAVTAGFIARVAICTTPFLLPLMFQIGFHATPFAAGMMLLVYMAGNLVMKSITTPILNRFSFREVVFVNGVLCVVTLIGCGLLTPTVPNVVIWAVLFAAGMTRSMNFTSMATLSFADVTPELRAGATTLFSMSQQAANALGVAIAALALGLFQTVRASDELALSDFHYAFFAAAAMMFIAVLWSRRLQPDAGAQLSSRA